jgi:hypothetical protein
MWSFLSPTFLFAAATALIPLILHLMQRRRTVRMPFSTIRFLKLAQKRSSNRIRMENFLLWLLRTLLMLVIAAAFAVPVVRTVKLGRLMGQAHRDVAIVLDVSYSMGYETGQRRVWDAARDAALVILRGLQNGDRASVFLAGARPVALIEKPSADLAMVQSLIQTLEPRPETSRLDEALPEALNSLKESGNREREVYLLTDGQALPWGGFNPTNRTDAIVPAPGTWDPARVDKDIAFFALLAGPRAPENCRPFEVTISPMMLMSNTTATLSARIARNGPATDLAVTLFIDDEEAGRRTPIVDANGIQTVSFPLPALSPGTHAARVVTPADGLALDDAFHFLIRVRRQLPTLCVGSEQESLFLMTALNAGQDGEAAGVQCVPPGELDEAVLRAHSSVFLVNALPLSGQTMLALERYVKNGGTLTLFPGDNAAPAAYRDWSILPAKPEAIAELPQGERVRALRLVLSQDPLFSGFILPPGATPTLAIRRALHWPNLEADSTIVIAAGDDLPFLASRYVGKGRVLLCAVSADRRWSTFPMTSFFLPMLHQIVQFGAGASRDPLYVWTAPNLILSDTLPELTESDQVLMPGGHPLAIRPVRQGTDILMEAEGVEEPGIYTLARGGQTASPVLAVNIERTESNLDPIDDATPGRVTGLRDLRLAHDGEDLQRQIEEYRQGRPLTETFFWLALGLAIVEWWLANRISRSRAALVTAVKVQTSGRVTGPSSR